MNNINTTKRVKLTSVESQARAMSRYEDPEETAPLQTAEQARAERMAESLREKERVDRKRREAEDRATVERRAKWA